MSIKLHWFIPTAGDSRVRVGHFEQVRERPADIDYLAQVARTAERLGFHAVLLPTGLYCEDPWIVAAALSQATRRLRLMVAVRPGLLSPTLAAHMLGTCQRITGGRIDLQIVAGGSSEEQRMFGDHASHDERYDRVDEFLQVLRGVWTSAPFDHSGQHYRIERAQLTLDPPGPFPAVYFGGASPAAERVAASRADVYLLFGETPDMVAERVARMRALAGDRSLRFGIRIHVIARDTAEEAWAVTRRYLAGMDPDTIARAQERQQRSESVGQQRMRSLHGGSMDHLEIAPNLWAGLGLVRGSSGTALVGSHAEVADRLEEYHRIGVDEFILSGYPHLEEAYAFAEGVIPILDRRGLLQLE